MPLVFSPLSEDVLSSPPRTLYPNHAFIMRQLGDPPQADKIMTAIIIEELGRRGLSAKDASASTGGNDFLLRILGMIRGTGFTIAIFSHETRPTAMANIFLELGLAALCGKPLVIAKSREAASPSDLARTDWIEYSADQEDQFRHKIQQALDTIDDLARYETTLLDVAMDATTTDCAVAFERANKAFLLTADPRFLDIAKDIKDRLDRVTGDTEVADLDRLRNEIAVFIRQGRTALRSLAGTAR